MWKTLGGSFREALWKGDQLAYIFIQPVFILFLQNYHNVCSSNSWNTVKRGRPKKITLPSALISMSYGFNISKQLTPCRRTLCGKSNAFLVGLILVIFFSYDMQSKCPNFEYNKMYCHRMNHYTVVKVQKKKKTTNRIILTTWTHFFKVIKGYIKFYIIFKYVKMYFYVHP